MDDPLLATLGGRRVGKTDTHKRKCITRFPSAYIISAHTHIALYIEYFIIIVFSKTIEIMKCQLGHSRGVGLLFKPKPKQPQDFLCDYTFMIFINFEGIYQLKT